MHFDVECVLLLTVLRVVRLKVGISFVLRLQLHTQSKGRAEKTQEKDETNLCIDRKRSQKTILEHLVVHSKRSDDSRDG